MEHDKFQDQLDGYLDGRLAGGEKQIIEDHLDGCAACRLYVENWQKVRTAFFSAPQITASGSFVVRVMQEIEKGTEWSLKAFLRWAFPTFALMGAALFFISIWPAGESVAFEAAALRQGGIFTVHEAAEIQNDWTGLEAL